MSLRNRILLATTVVLGSLLATLYGLGREELQRGYREAETAQARTHLESVRQLIDYELRALDDGDVWNFYNKPECLSTGQQLGFFSESNKLSVRD